MDIKKILWATDGSKEAGEAFKLAAYISRKFSSEILCLNVNEIHIPIAHLHPSYEGMIMDITEQSGSKFMKRFGEIAAENPDIKFSSKIVRDRVVDGIIDTASREGADLILMGKHGHGLIGRALLGSNTLKVLRKSPVPVLSVKLGEGVDGYDIKKILVPVDISDTAESSLWSALGIADALGASVAVVYVFWLSGNVYELSPKLVDELIAQARTQLDSTVERVKNEYAGVKGNSVKADVSTHVINGVSPGVTVVDYANNNDFDLIVVTTHGRKGIERLILGSETEKIIREAHCPVLALKP